MRVPPWHPGTLARFVHGTLALWLVSACGGNGPSSTLPQITGTFTGDVTYRSASPDTQCYAQFLRSLGTGHNYNVTVTVQQTGDQIQGALRGTQIRTACSFSGDIQPGGSMRWQQTSCPEACTTFADGSCAATRICVVFHAFSGQASGSRISGTHNVTWDLFDLTSGDSLGRLDISGSIDVNR
jgi:hypothetical protein